jgi:GNAT superfamily N-acetyltransferase
VLGCGHPHPGNARGGADVCTDMSDNLPATIRPIEPGDKDRLAAFFSRLSDETRRRRFLGPKPKLSPRELQFLTEVDQCRHVALVAVDADDAIVGVGRYATWHDSPDRAEMAFVVLDAWQGHGLGTRLGEHLVARARTSGIAALTGSTFATNTPAKALLKRLGFLPKGISAGIADYELALGATA